MSAKVQVEGLVSIACKRPVAETLAALEAALLAKGVKVFAVIDHSGEAEKAGFKMRPTKLIIFGNPKAGTPLMLEAATIAIDLPVRALIWEDAAGQTWLSYYEAEYLVRKHGLATTICRKPGWPHGPAARRCRLKFRLLCSNYLPDSQISGLSRADIGQPFILLRFTMTWRSSDKPARFCLSII